MSNDNQKALLAQYERELKIIEINHHRIEAAVNILRVALADDPPTEAPAPTGDGDAEQTLAQLKENVLGKTTES